MEKKKNEDISRRTFITDTGKTLFFTAMAASVVPTFMATSCTKGGTVDETGVLTVSADGTKKACAHNYVCDDDYACGKGSFNCNHCFYCDDGFDCAGPKFHCHNDGYECGNDDYACGEAYNCHYGGKGR